MTDDQGLQYFLFVVEDELGKADDVIAQFEQIVSRAGAGIPAGPDREELRHCFRILVQPLVELELKRRAGKGVVEDDDI
jgi:hypothetical protein